MTINDLLAAVSKDTWAMYLKMEEEIKGKILTGIEDSATEREILIKMIFNSIALSMSLSVQTTIYELIAMGAINREEIEQAEIKPKMHLVRPEKEVKESLDTSEAEKNNDEVKITRFRERGDKE